MTQPPDTLLHVPNGFVVWLTLDVERQELPDLTSLLERRSLDAIDAAVRDADQPYEHARTWVREGIAKLRTGDFVCAVPMLSCGMEALYRATAQSRGLIDEKGLLRSPEFPAGTKAGGPELVRCLGINERVQRMLKRFAFGDPANVYRHGGEHPKVGWQEQCLLWLLAIVAWLDMQPARAR